jgi:hypothetical protein
LDLMQRRWFSRRWVVQEIALAREAVIYCGADKIPWKGIHSKLLLSFQPASHWRLAQRYKADLVN